MSELKPVEFCGDSREVLERFPAPVRRKAGHQLELVQLNIEPEDWKPMSTIGPGVCEIRIRDDSGIYRMMYVAKFHSAIYVLHCFQKKTQKTNSSDLETATRRYKPLLQEHTR